MKVAQGILTVRGGMTSHAAVVARGMGTCCVAGLGDIVMDEANKKFTLGGKTFHEGDYTPTNRTTVNHPSGAAMRPDSDPRQSRRTHNYYEFTFFIFRITARASGEAELNPELTARSASKHFPRPASALSHEPERIHQPGT